MTDVSGWKSVAKEGDPEILFHEGLVRADLRSQCEGHEPDVWCRRCIERAKTSVYFAGLLVDPTGLPEVDFLPSPDALPEKLALVNTMTKSAYVMRREETRRLTATKPLWTTRVEQPFRDRIRILDHTTSNSVCDAIHMRGFFIRLAPDVREEYVRRFGESTIEVRLDGEIVFGDKLNPLRVKELLGREEVLFEKPLREPVLFMAAACPDGKAADPETWLGYMLPNGTRIEIDLKGVPGGAGLVRIECGTVLTGYTTKKLYPEPVKTEMSPG
ncbi:MAG: hypothetical protein A2W26_01065 [Acidobacteria bacterium RBG_16_64_8]|nr:MAG: hypothetical protein A2W26_01065 [Acidobacteria bacterium RBG_16_64_8]